MDCGNLLVGSGVDCCYRPFRDRGRLVELDRDVVKARLPALVAVPVKHVKTKGLDRLFEVIESFSVDIIMRPNGELQNKWEKHF